MRESKKKEKRRLISRGGFVNVRNLRTMLCTPLQAGEREREEREREREREERERERRERERERNGPGGQRATGTSRGSAEGREETIRSRNWWCRLTVHS